jgi:hypothetical protein
LDACFVVAKLAPSPLPAALDQELFNGGGSLHETTLAEYGQHDTTYKG